MIRIVILFLFFTCSSACVAGLPGDSLPQKMQERYLKRIEKKYEGLERKLQKKTDHYLSKMQRREKKLMRKAGKFSLDGVFHAHQTDSAWSLVRKQFAASGDLSANKKID